MRGAEPKSRSAMSAFTGSQLSQDLDMLHSIELEVDVDTKGSRRTNRGFSSATASPLAFRSSLTALLRAITAALRRSAYSQPAGDRSESAL